MTSTGEPPCFEGCLTCELDPRDNETEADWKARIRQEYERSDVRERSFTGYVHRRSNTARE